MNWGEFKSWLGPALGVSNDALHVNAGLAIVCLAAIMMRRPPWSWPPICVVVAAESLNEAYDLFLSLGPNNENGLPFAIHDFALTLLWPLLILIVFPRFARLARRPHAAREGRTPGDDDSEEARFS